MSGLNQRLNNMQNVATWFFGLPEKGRMVLMAFAGMFIGLCTYEIIYWVNPLEPRASSSWLASFTIGIYRQHALHYHFTFRKVPPYGSSLLKAFIMYSSSAAIGFVLNYILIHGFHLNHRIVWSICLLVTATISLVFLKKKVFG
jgi:putative flippase GtrA